MNLAERFERQYTPEPNTGCWLWIGACDRHGYGAMRDKYAQKKAHRVAYEMFKGPIPHGLQLDHLCRVPQCVNPDHLEPVTSRENTRRGLQGVLKTHCKKGHPFSGDNILVWRGLRLCRACRSDKYRAWYRRTGRQGRKRFTPEAET